MLGLICVTPNVIGTIKQNRMRWSEHVALVNAKGNAYTTLSGEPERRLLFRWEDNIKTDLKEIWWKTVDWIMWFRTRRSGEVL